MQSHLNISGSMLMINKNHKVEENRERNPCFLFCYLFNSEKSLSSTQMYEKYVTCDFTKNSVNRDDFYV